MTAEPTAPESAAEPRHAGVSRMRGESLLLTASYGLTALVGVAFWAVAARTEPASQLGLATAVISAFTAAAVVGGTGIANAFLAMLPIAGAARGRLLSYGYSILTAACLVTGAIAGTIAGLAVPAIGSALQTGLVITFASVLWGMFVVQDSVLIAFGKAKWLLIENIPVGVLKLGLLPVIALVVNANRHPVVIATIAPSVLAVLVVTGVVIPRLAGSTERDERAAAGPGRATAGQWLDGHRREFQLFALRDGAASAMNLGLFMFLPFLVTATAGATEGAVFALTLQISTAMDLFTVGVGVSLTTNAATDHGAGPAMARVMWKRLARIMSGVAVLVIAGSPVLLLIFGRTYLSHDGWQIVVILVAGSLLRTTFEVWTALLRALRHTRLLLSCTSLTSGTLLVAVLVGARLGGALGAAIGVTLATVPAFVIGALGLLGYIGEGLPRLFGRRPPSGPGKSWPWQGFPPARTDGMHEVGTYFGPVDAPNFGWLSVPDAGTAALAVVLCPPVGEEQRSAHRTFRHLGIALARRGILALRIDYPGTGDSAGGQDDPGLVAAWQQSIRDAAHHLRSMGVADVAVVGMRLGATLAGAVAAEGGFGSVVLWDPCATGRGFVREGQALHALGGNTDDEPQHQGEVYTPGFRYSAETVGDLRGLSLAALPAHAWCARLLTLTRTGRPVTGAAFAAPHVQVGTALGQEALIGVEPTLALVPHRSLEAVADWLAAGADRTRPAAFAMQARHEASLRDPATGREIRERIVALGPQRLFAIVTEPVRPSTSAPWVMMSNVALDLHIGPGRCWVDFARAWAALGMRCVRFDHSGLGDSPLRPGQNEDRIFDPLWLDDFPEVYDALGSGSAPIAALGLSSGGYAALEAAMRRPLDAVYGIGAHVTYPDMALGERAYSPERIAARPFTRPFARLHQRDVNLAAGLWRLYRQFAVWHAPMHAVRAVTRAGTTVRILAAPKDAEAYREVVWWTVVRRRSTLADGRYMLHVDPSIDHSLLTQRAQRRMFADATQFWAERYGIDPVALDASPVGSQLAPVAG